MAAQRMPRKFIKIQHGCKRYSPNLWLFKKSQSSYFHVYVCRWVLAYRDAASFRFSHYFVCFLSEVTMVMSGLGASKNNGDIRW